MTTWFGGADLSPLLAAQPQQLQQPLPSGHSPAVADEEDYDDVECNKMVNDWVAKLLDSRRNSLVDAAAAVAPISGRQLDHNDNKVPMKAPIGWAGLDTLSDDNGGGSVAAILSDALRESLQIEPTTPQQQIKSPTSTTAGAFGSHDSGYGISPTNTGPTMGAAGDAQLVVPLMALKTSIPSSTQRSASNPSEAAQPKTQLRPICKSKHCDPGPAQYNSSQGGNGGCMMGPGSMGSMGSERGHLRPVSSIVARPGCSVGGGGSGHDLPTLPPPEYIRNMPPPPTSVSKTSGGGGSTPPKPGFQSTTGMRPITRSWNVRRAEASDFVVRQGGGPKGRVYKTNSSWVKVPTPPATQQQGGVPLLSHGVPKSLMTAAVNPTARYTPAPPGPGAELHLRLEQVIEFFKRLERDRKATEAEMSRMLPGKKITTSGINFQSFPRLPPNPSRVDRVICENLREHARVTLLIKKMERMAVKRVGHGPGFSTGRNSKHMTTWKEAVDLVQLRRSQEMHVMDKNDKEHILPLAQAIAQLCGAIKRVRTVLWCTLQSTVTALKEA